MRKAVGTVFDSRAALVLATVREHRATEAGGWRCACGDELPLPTKGNADLHTAKQILLVLDGLAAAAVPPREELIERAVRTVTAGWDDAAVEVLRQDVVRMHDEVYLPVLHRGAVDLVDLLPSLLAGLMVEGYMIVFDGRTPPGGWVCIQCGDPVESEPCACDDTDMHAARRVVDVTELRAAAFEDSPVRRMAALTRLLERACVDVVGGAPVEDVHLPAEDVVRAPQLNLRGALLVAEHQAAPKPGHPIAAELVRPGSQCGTGLGHARHVDAGEPPCQECTAALAELSTAGVVAVDQAVQR